jgi:hypothetical protein
MNMVFLRCIRYWGPERVNRQRLAARPVNIRLAVNPHLLLSIRNVSAPAAAHASIIDRCDHRERSVLMNSSWLAANAMAASFLRGRVSEASPSDRAAVSKQPAAGSSPAREARPYVRFAPARRPQWNMGIVLAWRRHKAPPGIVLRAAGGLPAMQLLRQPARAEQASTEGTAPSRTIRQENRWLAPPPMTPHKRRSAGRPEANHGREIRAAAPAETTWHYGAASSAQPMMGGSGAFHANPANIEMLTDQVMNSIDRRVRARRERLGKI